jgi:hypothetical protein
MDTSLTFFAIPVRIHLVAFNPDPTRIDGVLIVAHVVTSCTEHVELSRVFVSAARNLGI